MKITRCDTLKQAADLFTKPFTKPDAWERVISFVGLIKTRQGLSLCWFEHQAGTGELGQRGGSGHTS